MSPTLTTDDDAVHAEAISTDHVPEPPSTRLSKAQNRRTLLVRIGIGLLVLFFLSQLRVHWNTLTRVDSPFTLRADDRLSVLEPDAEEEVNLPMTVEWELHDYDLADGEQFVVYVDKGFPGPRKFARLTICSEQGKLPPQPGELRAPCKDDREKVFFTTDTSISFDCFEPRFSAGRRRQHEHTVSVIIVDAELKRVGETAASVSFRVDEDDADACRGF